MKIYTNENNTATLKLLIAANLAGQKVELKTCSFEDLPSGPQCLPHLEVDHTLYFFSSNAAVQFLCPALDMAQDGKSKQMLEWEATRLYPAVAALVTTKTPTSELKQTLQALLSVLDNALKTNQCILGDKQTSVDVSVWSTLYPLCYNEELKHKYMAEFSSIGRWAERIAAAEATQEALKVWGGSAAGPFGPQSALGPPLLSNLMSPISSPEEAPEAGPTAEEVEAAREAWERGLEELQPPMEEQKIVLPVKGKRNVLITSALPYVNNVPHLGNIIGCVLSADIFARYCRICDYNTLFVCGTDEYGTATETKALEEGVTPRQICDKYFDIHNSVYRWFNIGFDYFGRTSTEHQTQIAQKMFLKLMDNGFVSAQSVDQLYCENCDRFLADRFVEGTCPHPGCLYESARGDQCDKCGKLINAIELIKPACKVCAKQPRLRQSEQLFIELGQLEPSLRSWIATAEGGWSAPARAVTRAWLREALRARAVTRDLKWGVPVPVEGYTNKVFYVWFDAPIGYLSITQAATAGQYESWWKADKEYDVKLYQFMAKDNVPFHVIMFPATVIGVNEGHILVDHIYATEYLNYEEGKFSKSRGVGVFGTDAQETGIPADVWRFYLASIRPETSDSSFSWTELGTRNNSELLNNLGNFCHRSLSFCAGTYKGVVPAVRAARGDYELMALVNREVVAYVQNMEKGRLREALRHVMSVSKLGNQHMQSAQPWVLLKGSDEDRERGATAIGICCQLVALLCALLQPYMPETCRRLRAQLGLAARPLRINPRNPSLIQYLPAGHAIGSPEPLFSKIEPALLDRLRARYAGTQSERARAGAAAADVAGLEAAVAAQGEVVRKLKASTKDKAVWQPEVTKLLDLKKQLAAAQSSAKAAPVGAKATPVGGKATPVGAKATPVGAKATPVGAKAAPVDANALPDSAESTADLEKAIAEQGNKVRQLKASTKDKAAWQAEVSKLLELKKRLADAQAPVASVAGLEEAVARQGDVVRKLKASTKDKTVWQPEVNKLLDLKKQLAALQVK